MSDTPEATKIIEKRLSLSLTLAWLAFCIGVFLLCLNLIGFFIPKRSTLIYSVVAEDNHGTSLSYEDALKQIDRGPKESNQDYTLRLNSVINRTMLHDWEDSNITRYNLTIPPYHNYLLYLGSFIRPDIYLKYEFCNPYRALQRGVGWCSEHAIALTGILGKNDVQSRLITLKGHVVSEVLIDPATNTLWIADPDHGTVIKKSLSEIEQDPGLVREPYLAAGVSPSKTDDLVALYEKDGNQTFDWGVNGYVDCSTFKTTVTKVSYFLIWAIPALLILPMIVWFFRIARARKRASGQPMQ